MDLDAELKRLTSWKRDVEQLLSPKTLAALLALSASEQAGDLGEHIAALQASFDKVDWVAIAALEGRIFAVETKLANLQAPDLSPLTGRLDKVEGSLANLTDPATVDLLNWLAGEQQSLQVLLSLGDPADAQAEVPKNAGASKPAVIGTDGKPVVEPPPGGSQSGAGAAPVSASTDAAPGAQGSQAGS